MIFISILCTLLNSTSYYVFFFFFYLFFGFALYPSPPGLIYTLITLLSFSYSPLDVEKEGRSRAWLARFSSPPFLRLFFFLLLPSRRRKGGEVPRVVGALLLPSFSPSLFLSSPPLSTSKRRGGSARGRRASPPLLFSRLSSPPHPLPCMLPCSTASFYFVQPSQLSQLTLPPFAIKDKFKARQARAKLVIIIIIIIYDAS